MGFIYVFVLKGTREMSDDILEWSRVERGKHGKCFSGGIFSGESRLHFLLGLFTWHPSNFTTFISFESKVDIFL